MAAKSWLAVLAQPAKLALLLQANSSRERLRALQVTVNEIHKAWIRML